SSSMVRLSVVASSSPPGSGGLTSAQFSTVRKLSEAIQERPDALSPSTTAVPRCRKVSERAPSPTASGTGTAVLSPQAATARMAALLAGAAPDAAADPVHAPNRQSPLRTG